MKFLFLTLSAFFCLGDVPSAMAQLEAIPSKSDVAGQQNKGFLDDVIDTVIDSDQLCIPIIGCIDAGQVTEDLLMDQLRSALAEERAPIAVNTDNIFPPLATLPGQAFEPTLLPLPIVGETGVIPPGDYIVPVMGVCLEQQFSSPDGHGYHLGRYSGTRADILKDFHQIAASNRLEYPEIQGVAWAIRSGVQYDDMPVDMQEIIATLMPQHVESLNQTSFLSEIRDLGNTVTTVFGYASLDQFLRLQGDVGQLAAGLLRFEEELQAADDWRSLSNQFLSPGIGANAAIDAPWSQIEPGLYGRFITSGGAGETGMLLLRVTDQSLSAQAKNLPAPQELNNSVTGAELNALIASLVAIPQGNAAIQPLGFVPETIGNLPRNPDGSIDVAALPAALPWLLTILEAAILAEGGCTVSGNCTSLGERLAASIERWNSSNAQEEDNPQRPVLNPENTTESATGMPEPEDPDQEPTEPTQEQSLRRIHSDENLRRRSSYEYWQRQSSEDIIRSLQRGQEEPLTITPDGRIFQGNTRALILEERGFNLNELIRTGRINPENHTPMQLP